METYPTVELRLRPEDAIVFFDWIQEGRPRISSGGTPAVKQALTDLLSRLEEIIPYEFDLTPPRVEQAREPLLGIRGW